MKITLNIVGVHHMNVYSICIFDMPNYENMSSYPQHSGDVCETYKTLWNVNIALYISSSLSCIYTRYIHMVDMLIWVNYMVYDSMEDQI